MRISAYKIISHRLGAVSGILGLTVAIGTPVFAQNLYVSSDRTVSGGNPINGTYDQVRIGRDSSGGNFTGVHADITGGVYNGALFSFNDSLVNITGGDFKNVILPQNSSVLNFGGTATAENVLAVFNKATLNVTGGSVVTLQVGASGDTAIANVSGAVQINYLNANANTTTNITGGMIGILYPFDDSVVNLKGGTVSELITGKNSVINFTGGIVTDYPFLLGHSVLNFGGSAQIPFIQPQEFSTVNLSGGSIASDGFVDSIDHGTVNFTGGVFTVPIFGDGGAYNISGGIFDNTTFVNSGPLFNLDYSDFRIFGTYISVTNATAGTYTDNFGDNFDGVFWNLKGRLQNGDLLNTRYFEVNGSLSGPVRLTIVPEPGAAAFFMGIGCFGGLCLLSRRRRK